MAARVVLGPSAGTPRAPAVWWMRCPRTCAGPLWLGASGQQARPQPLPTRSHALIVLFIHQRTAGSFPFRFNTNSRVLRVRGRLLFGGSLLPAGDGAWLAVLRRWFGPACWGAAEPGLFSRLLRRAAKTSGRPWEPVQPICSVATAWRPEPGATAQPAPGGRRPCCSSGRRRRNDHLFGWSSRPVGLWQGQDCWSAGACLRALDGQVSRTHGRSRAGRCWTGLAAQAPRPAGLQPVASTAAKPPVRLGVD